MPSIAVTAKPRTSANSGEICRSRPIRLRQRSTANTVARKTVRRLTARAFAGLSGSNRQAGRSGASTARCTAIMNSALAIARHRLRRTAPNRPGTTTSSCRIIRKNAMRTSAGTMPPPMPSVSAATSRRELLGRTTAGSRPNRRSSAERMAAAARSAAAPSPNSRPKEGAGRSPAGRPRYQSSPDRATAASVARSSGSATPSTAGASGNGPRVSIAVIHSSRAIAAMPRSRLAARVAVSSARATWERYVTRASV